MQEATGPYTTKEITGTCLSVDGRNSEFPTYGVFFLLMLLKQGNTTKNQVQIFIVFILLCQENKQGMLTLLSHSSFSK